MSERRLKGYAAKIVHVPTKKVFWVGRVDKSIRVVEEKSARWVASELTINDYATMLVGELQPRIELPGISAAWRHRLIPIYAVKPRSAKRERQDVLSELRGHHIAALAEHGECIATACLESAIKRIELGKHETEGDAA